MGLSAQQCYDAEVGRVCRVNKEQEISLINRARCGDNQAKEALILSLLPSVRHFARRFHRSYTWIGYQIEAMDLVCAGNFALVEYFDQALQRENPCAYLLSTAYGAIKLYCQRYQSHIVTPSTPGTLATIVESLDAPCFRQNDEDDENSGSQSITLSKGSTTPVPSIDFQPLYEVLQRFSSGTQHLIAHLFGLQDTELMSIAEYSGGGADTQAYRRVMSRKSWALAQMRSLLASYYPHYASSLRQIRHTYDGLTLSREQIQRLDRAAQQLQEQGQQLTVRTLRSTVRMHPSYVSAYLTQQKARLGYPEPEKR